jgi:hypothetical protein
MTGRTDERRSASWEISAMETYVCRGLVSRCHHGVRRRDLKHSVASGTADGVTLLFTPSETQFGRSEWVGD